MLLSLLGPFDPTWVYTAVLMAALPPALNVFIMARQYDTWVAQASGSVLFGTFVSVVTLTDDHVAGEDGHAARNLVPVTMQALTNSQDRDRVSRPHAGLGEALRARPARPFRPG